MLPFFAKKKEASVSAPPSVIRREADEPLDMDDDEQMLMHVAHELIESVHKRNTEHFILALRAAFQILDSEPHEEGPHLENEE